jgi:hypothetical protein
MTSGHNALGEESVCNTMLAEMLGNQCPYGATPVANALWGRMLTYLIRRRLQAFIQA